MAFMKLVPNVRVWITVQWHARKILHLQEMHWLPQQRRTLANSDGFCNG